MKCPYCAEEVKDEAVVCRYCHRDLTSVRLYQVERALKQRLDATESRLLEMDQRLGRVEAALGTGLPPGTWVAAGQPTWLIYTIAFLLGATVPTVSAYVFLLTHAAIMLSLPFLALIVAGTWAGVSDRDHTVKRYALLSAAIGVADFVGMLATIHRVVYDQPLAAAILGAVWPPLWRAWRGASPLLLFVAPFFLVLLGGFIGEWLVSLRSPGTKMRYPGELAEQLLRLAPGSESSVDVERLSKALEMLAPLVAALGGIAAPVITALVSR